MSAHARLAMGVGLAALSGYALVWLATWPFHGLCQSYGAPIPVGHNSGALFGSPGDAASDGLFWIHVAITAALFLVIRRVSGHSAFLAALGARAWG